MNLKNLFKKDDPYEDSTAKDFDPTFGNNLLGALLKLKRIGYKGFFSYKVKVETGIKVGVSCSKGNKSQDISVVVENRFPERFAFELLEIADSVVKIINKK